MKSYRGHMVVHITVLLICLSIVRCAYQIGEENTWRCVLQVGTFILIVCDDLMELSGEADVRYLSIFALVQF